MLTALLGVIAFSPFSVALLSISNAISGPQLIALKFPSSFQQVARLQEEIIRKSSRKAERKYWEFHHLDGMGLGKMGDGTTGTKNEELPARNIFFTECDQNRTLHPLFSQPTAQRGFRTEVKA